MSSTTPSPDLARQAHLLTVHLVLHPHPRAEQLLDRAYRRWQRRADAQAATPIPAPSAELRASVKRRGYDIIECIVAGERIGYYAFLDGAWLGLNGRKRLPTSYNAAYRMLDAARAAQQGITPGQAYRNQRSQHRQYLHR